MRYSPRIALLATVLSACGSGAPKNDTAAPADQPAVIAVPLNVPTPKVSQTASSAPKLIPDDPTERNAVLSTGYALVTATMINQDARVLGTLYAPDAQLHTPAGTLSGVAPVVRRLLDLSRTKSLSEFQRMSQHVRLVDDSTLVDSGSYVMTSKRQAKDSTMERGQYVATWRARTARDKWVMLEDALTPAAPSRGKAKSK